MNTLSKNISVVLLAGGKGERMKTAHPKQFMKISGKAIALYSFEIFLSHPQVQEIVVVCKPEYQSFFKNTEKPVLFALPGKRRQDSAYNGLKVLQEKEGFICVHDAARPCINLELLDRLFEAAYAFKAATLGVQATSTLKEVNSEGMIVKALERSKTWEIQTPQVVERTLLERAFEKVNKELLDVTDETSLLEQIGHPVKVVVSSTRNMKLTEPSDFKIIESFLSEKRFGV